MDIQRTEQPDGLSLCGALDIGSVGAVWAALLPLREQSLSIDLSGVMFADTAGLQLLLILQRDAPTIQLNKPSDCLLLLAETLGQTSLFAEAL